MEALRFARFRVSFKTLERAAYPPDKGPIFRRGLIQSLREAACGRAPGVCPLGTAPFPFVFCPPTDARPHLFAGDTLLSSLVLVGTAVEHIGCYIDGLDRHGRKGLTSKATRVVLEQVDMLDPRDSKYASFYFSKEQTIKTRVVPFEWEHLVARANLLQGRTQISLKLLTPLRMSGDLPLIDRLLQRLSALSIAYCGGRPGPGVEHEVTVQQDGLQWTDRPCRLPQARGSLKLCGDLEPIFPMLVAGQHLHVGAGATMGFGRYELGP